MTSDGQENEENRSTPPHPSEDLHFDTIHHTIRQVHIRIPHPSEQLEFATVPFHVLGHGGARPHPSEALEFGTVHESLRQGRGAPFGSPRKTPLKKTSWTFEEALAETSDSPRRSSSLEFSPSATSKTEAGHLEYVNSRSETTGTGERPPGPHRGHSINDVMHRLASTVPGLSFVESKAATHKEHAMTLREGIRTYPKAMAWSLMLSCTLIMEGYDLSLINGFYAFPSFIKRYGHQLPSGEYEITTAWQQSLINGAVVGEIFGLMFNGIMTERIGYRRSLLYALVLLCGGIFLSFFSVHIWMLMTSEIICGLAWGVFQTLSTTYAAEVMPMSLRAYLTANVNLCWLIGQVIGLSVLRGTVNWQSDWSYRLPFGLQWAWALPILCGTLFAPESPWWLVRSNRLEDAKHSLSRLTTAGTGFNAHEAIQLMRHTNEVEKELTAGTSYWDCFKGVDLHRTEIVCVAWVIQVTCGGPMSGYSAYFFTRAGLQPTRAYDLSAAMYGLAILAHLLALILMRYIGRRRLYMFGCLAMSITLFIMGGISTLSPISPTSSTSTSTTSPNDTTIAWIVGALNVLVTFWYDLTIGPVCYSLVSEIPSTRLRVKTVSLGRIAYNGASIVANVVMPQMLALEAWNLKGRTSFLWAVTALLSLVWCYWRLPEPKGLTYMELDILFQKKAGARKFRKVCVCLQENGYFELVEEDKAEKNLHWEGVAA